MPNSEEQIKGSCHLYYPLRTVEDAEGRFFIIWLQIRLVYQTLVGKNRQKIGKTVHFVVHEYKQQVIIPRNRFVAMVERTKQKQLDFISEFGGKTLDYIQKQPRLKA